MENEFLTKGIPGVTSRPEWFGIDYHGEFWIGQPGEYSFELTSDDGADLYIDDVLVIGLDVGHQPLTAMRSVRLGGGMHPALGLTKIRTKQVWPSILFQASQL